MKRWVFEKTPLDVGRYYSSLLIWCRAVMGVAGLAAAFTAVGAVMFICGEGAYIVGAMLDLRVKQLLAAVLALVLSVLFIPFLLVSVVLQNGH